MNCKYFPTPFTEENNDRHVLVLAKDSYGMTSQTSNRKLSLTSKKAYTKAIHSKSRLARIQRVRWAGLLVDYKCS